MFPPEINSAFHPPASADPRELRPRLPLCSRQSVGQSASPLRPTGPVSPCNRRTACPHRSHTGAQFPRGDGIRGRAISAVISFSDTPQVPISSAGVRITGHSHPNARPGYAGWCGCLPITTPHSATSRFNRAMVDFSDCLPWIMSPNTARPRFRNTTQRMKQMNLNGCE